MVLGRFPEDWWDCAGMLIVHDKMADGKTAYEKRHGELARVVGPVRSKHPLQKPFSPRRVSAASAR